MNVLIVHHQMALYGGAEVVVVRLANYLKAQGHEVSVLAASTSEHPEYKGLNIITPGREVNWHLWDGTISSMREIYQVLTSLRKLCNDLVDDFDVVNAHNFPTIWAVPPHKKTVWMCNEVPELWHRDAVPLLLNTALNVGRLADRTIVRSKSPTAVVPDQRCARRFNSRYGFRPEIVPYGIDGEFFSQHVDVPVTGKFRILQPSMISPSKGQLEVLEASKVLDAAVTFAGYYEPRHPYTEKLMLDSTGLDVTFTGHINKEGLRVLYKMAHVAVFPGKGQGSWLGPFESVAAGCPVIVSPNLSCSDLVRQQDLGLVSDDLPEALREVYVNYPKYRRQARAGQEFVLNQLTWDNFGKRFLEVLQT